MPPKLSDERTPISGNSSATTTVESPKRSLTLMSLPPGTGLRLYSLAPKAFVYHSAVRAAPLTTMCGVTVCVPSGTGLAVGSVIALLLFVTLLGSSEADDHTRGSTKPRWSSMSSKVSP